MNIEAKYMVFNTCNLKFSLVIKFNDNLIVHTQIEESQAKQIKEELNLRTGVMGTDESYASGAKHTHNVYWDL